MKYFPLIWATLWRKKTRTIFTLLSVVVAFLLFGMLETVDYALGAGAKRVVITHPELAAPKLDLPTMIDLAKAGCFMEFCAVDLFPMFYCISLNGLIEAIDAVTPERTILSSDGGQPFHPRPHECLRVVAHGMVEKGVPMETIQKICIDNHKYLLNL